jgi:hypothetical protein
MLYFQIDYLKLTAGHKTLWMRWYTGMSMSSLMNFISFFLSQQHQIPI